MTDSSGYEHEINGIGVSLAAAATYELLEAFVTAGFTREEAYGLVKIQFAASMAAAHARRQR